MSHDGIKVSVKGPDLVRVVNQYAHRLGDPTMPMRDVGEYLLGEVRERFQKQEDPEGRAWAPLSPQTIAAKGHNRILHQTGRLAGSMTYRASRTGVEVGTNMVYGPIHQFGGTVKHEARDVTVRFRTNARGEMLSQADQGKTFRNAGKFRVFASEKHKRFVEKAFQAGPYETNMPGRPVLGINNADWIEIGQLLKEWAERRFPQS